MKRSHGKLADLVNYLRTAPEEDAAEALRLLRTASGFRRATTIARGNAPGDDAQLPGGPRQNIPTRLRVDTKSALNGLCPGAYPVLPQMQATPTELLSFVKRRQPRSTDAKASKRPKKESRPVFVCFGSIEVSSSTDIGHRGVSSLSPGLQILSTQGSLETASDLSGTSQSQPPRVLCDPRLRHVEIGYWTKIKISNELAADILSCHFKTDHMLMGLVDADLFIEDLIAKQERFCSSLLVNAMLFFCCVSVLFCKPSEYLLILFRSFHMP